MVSKKPNMGRPTPFILIRNRQSPHLKGIKNKPLDLQL